VRPFSAVAPITLLSNKVRNFHSECPSGKREKVLWRADETARLAANQQTAGVVGTTASVSW
jgi:hypothetical protein